MGPEALAVSIIGGAVALLLLAGGLALGGWKARGVAATAERDAHQLREQRLRLLLEHAGAELAESKAAHMRDRAAAETRLESARRGGRLPGIDPGDLDGAVGLLFPEAEADGGGAPGGGAAEPPPGRSTALAGG